MSISNQAMLVELNIGNWTANKLDRQVSDEVDLSKGTKVKAGNYRKNLLAGVKELEDIKNFVGNFRNWHYKQTIPWSDSGIRLLTLKQYINYTSEVNAKIQDTTAGSVLLGRGSSGAGDVQEITLGAGLSGRHRCPGRSVRSQAAA